jgi:hypothetical protein
MPNFLCSHADILVDKGGRQRGALPKLQTQSISNILKEEKAGLPHMGTSGGMPMCSYSGVDPMGLGIGCGGLGFSGGGSAEECKPASKTIDWQKTFCMKQYEPKWACDKPEFLRGGTGGQKPEPRALQQIKSSITGGLANGGLPQHYASATPKGHNPEFITGLTGYYACGGGTGQSDDIPAMLHDGDYVMDAETVSALGDGSSKAGKQVLDGFRQQVPHKAEGGSLHPVPAKIADGEYVFPASFVTALGGGDNKRGAEILDGLRTKLRAHKRGAPLNKIPPKAKDPIDYIKNGKR